jgi:hypothetical protein
MNPPLDDIFPSVVQHYYSLNSTVLSGVAILCCWMMLNVALLKSSSGTRLPKDYDQTSLETHYPV